MVENRFTADNEQPKAEAAAVTNLVSPPVDAAQIALRTFPFDDPVNGAKSRTVPGTLYNKIKTLFCIAGGKVVGKRSFLTDEEDPSWSRKLSS